MQGTGAIRCRHDQRRFIPPRRAGVVFAEHQKACCVVGFVFDIFSQIRQAVTGSGGFAGNRRDGGLFGGHLRGLGIAADGNALGAGQHAIEPFVALGERLGVRIDRADSAQMRLLAEQILVDSNNHFATNFELSAEQQVHCPPDRALGRIFNRHNGVLRMSRFNFAKGIVYRGLRQQARGMAEMPDRRRF